MHVRCTSRVCMVYYTTDIICEVHMRCTELHARYTSLGVHMRCKCMRYTGVHMRCTMDAYEVF